MRGQSSSFMVPAYRFLPHLDGSIMLARLPRDSQDRCWNIALDGDLSGVDMEWALDRVIASLQCAAEMSGVREGGATLSGAVVLPGGRGFLYNLGDSQTIMVQRRRGSKPSFENKALVFYNPDQVMQMYLERKAAMQPKIIAMTAAHEVPFDSSFMPTDKVYRVDLGDDSGAEADLSDALKERGLMRKLSRKNFWLIEFKEALPYEEIRLAIQDVSIKCKKHQPLWRVKTGLAMTRAIGDVQHKVSSTPDIQAVVFDPLQELIVVAATDGVGDVISPKALVAYLAEKPVCAKIIVQYALGRWQAYSRESDDIAVASAHCEIGFSKSIVLGVADGHGHNGHFFAQLCNNVFEYAFPVFLKSLAQCREPNWAEARAKITSGLGFFISPDDDELIVTALESIFENLSKDYKEALSAMHERATAMPRPAGAGCGAGVGGCSPSP
jgi:serine/threonine protein phosphatase PrpC